MFNIICIWQACDDSFSDQLCFIPFKSDFDEEFEVEEILNSDMCEEHFI